MTSASAVLSNFDPIAIGDEIAALEMEAQSKLADAKGEFASRSEKIAAILWESIPPVTAVLRERGFRVKSWD